MRFTSIALNVGIICAISQLIHAQCPQLCDNDFKNTGVGFEALQHSNIACFSNTAMGYQALASNTDGDYNTAVGAGAQTGLGVGSLNTAVGSFALALNSIGWDNTAVGYEALSRCTNSGNTAVGTQALSRSTTATGNTAVGVSALGLNTTGINNTAAGTGAAGVNTTGNYNTAIGLDALGRNSTGSNNIAVGYFAGYNSTTGSNNIDIGSNVGVNTESNTIRIGTRGSQVAAYVAGISGAVVAGGIGVIIDSTGHLGTAISSARYKDNIQSMDNNSEAILSLRPVSFQYKKELDPEGIPQFGLVAEEVEKINPALVVRDHQGKAYSVRYEAVNAMLLNEFLKEHRKVESQSSEIADLKASVAELKTALREQSAQVQQIRAEITGRDKSVQTADNR